MQKHLWGVGGMGSLPKMSIAPFTTCTPPSLQPCRGEAGGAELPPLGQNHPWVNLLLPRSCRPPKPWVLSGSRLSPVPEELMLPKCREMFLLQVSLHWGLRKSGRGARAGSCQLRAGCGTCSGRQWRD